MDARYHLTRRRFVQGAGVAGLGLLVGCERWPGQAQVQDSQRVARLGYLGVGGQQSTEVSLLDGLREHGWVEGQNLVIERRSADGHSERYSAIAAELVALPVDLIIASAGTPAAVAAHEASSTIPVVLFSGDIVGTGLAESLARPGGNVTGVTSFSPHLAGKRLELLKETISGTARVAVVWESTNPTASVGLQAIEAQAGTLGVTLQTLEVRDLGDLEPAFETASEQADALLVVGGPILRSNAARVVGLAARRRLPAMYPDRAYAQAGGFMCYGPNFDQQARRAAYYVDRILRGAKPADLPIEQPMRFDFIINLQIAQALGLTIPQHVLLQATEIIQ